MGELRCAKCQSVMAEGFLRDITEGASYAAEWVAGVPERFPMTGGVDTRDRARHKITLYRCDSCGYLEAYARGNS